MGLAKTVVDLFNIFGLYRQFSASINFCLEALCLDRINTPTLKNAFVNLGGRIHLALEFIKKALANTLLTRA